MLTVPPDLISEFQVADDGKVFAKSERAIARLCDVAQQSMQATFEQTKGDSLKPSKLAEKLMQLGFKGDSLIPDIAVAVCIEHYAFDAGRYCTEVARNNYRSFAAIGIRAAFQQALGYVPRKYRRNPTTLYSEVSGLKDSVADLDESLTDLNSKADRIEARLGEVPPMPSVNQATKAIAMIEPFLPTVNAPAWGTYRVNPAQPRWKLSGSHWDGKVDRFQ